MSYTTVHLSRRSGQSEGWYAANPSKHPRLESSLPVYPSRPGQPDLKEMSTNAYANVIDTPTFTLRSVLCEKELTGPNFLDWERNLRIVLWSESKLYTLEHPVPDQLCGFQLPKECSERTHKPQLEEHEIHEDKSGFTWEVVTLGYGCGTLLGLVMGYLMLSTRKVKWFNLIADAGEHLILERNKRRYVFIGK
ncbi:hypothetical protein Tco_0520940 [Tanacetum coccineum]